MTSTGSVKLEISGIPVYSCDTCASSLHFFEGGPSLDDIILAVLQAIDRLTPSSFGGPIHTPNQCRDCRADLRTGDGVQRITLKTKERLPQGIEMIVVRYTGPGILCPICGTGHTAVTPATYHELTESIRRDGAMYVRETV